MSGDVQPRKRKDKKRRKDEGEQIPIQTHAPAPTNSSSDDVNIHVHKEGGTGGGICAKLVFFVLLSALVVVLGMIITQYRGLTDVETVDTESRFSHLFEGWIDSSPDHHDDHIEDTLDDHDIDHDEDDEHDASENDEDEEEEEHEPSEEEDENVDDTEVSDERNEDDEDDDDDQDEDEEQAVGESDENQVDEDEEDDDVQASEERETYESEEKDEDDEDNDDEQDNDDDEQDHDEDEQELENIESEEGKDEDDDADNDVSTEKKSRRDHEDEDEEDADEGEEDGDDTNAGKAHVITKRAEVKSAKDGSAPHEEKQQESAGMVVKLGVGVALLVVAHLVLVRKWRTAPDDKPKPAKEEPNEPSPNLSRRNTIVMPPTFQEVEPDIEPEEEYSEEEELSEEEVHETKSAKTRYQELRSTYTRSLTPEGEIGYHKPPETYDDEYVENVDDEEEEEISEEEEDDEEKQESEEEEDEEEYDEDEDEELLKRLEAKYGKLRGEGGATERQADIENSDSEKSDDGAEYPYSNITNKDDYKIKSDIDEAHKSVQNNSAFAIKLFDKILQKHPSSPRSIYGKALALDYLADQKRSNDILQEALNFYIQLLNMQNVPNALFKEAADRCINRMRFVGQYRNAINVHKLLIQKFPNDPKYSNDLAVTYLTINRIKEARSVLLHILDKWPNDGFALVHYGFILKTADNKLDEAVDYLQRGLETRAEGVIDGRFYFHLGDALARLGKNDKAMKVYEEGVKDKVFLSKYQRSLYNVPRLTGKPWWDPPDLPYLDLFRLLRQNWKKIRDEGMAVLNEKGYFQDESENLKDTGDWKQFELFARGQRNSNCRVCPVTCSIIERIPEAKRCKRGQTKFSVIHPGTHVWPHCGPTNCRLRVHLGLKVPPKTFIRVADETRSWEEGEILIFDDSFEHEVWHNGTKFRLVLIVDVWHPELTAAEKRSLSPI